MTVAFDRRDAAFTSLFGQQRGHATSDGDLTVPGAPGAERARTLISLVRAGAFNEPLAALTSLGPVAGADEAEEAYVWPPEDVAARAASRARDRRWQSNIPSDEAAELAFDGAEAVRRELAGSVISSALTLWLPVWRDFSHTIGLRRRDVAEHVVEIDGVLHLFQPANVMLAGDRRFPQSLVCGESAYQPAVEGRLHYVPLGYWYENQRAIWTVPMSEVARTHKLCPGCANNSSAVRYEVAKIERAADYLPLPYRFEWVPVNATARTHQHLQRHPSCGEKQLRTFATSALRGAFLGLISEPVQRDDKPCLWYRAPGLNDDERREVNRLTYDARIYNDPLSAMLEAQLPADPAGFSADAAWERAWCERLLAHVRARAAERAQTQ